VDRPRDSEALQSWGFSVDELKDAQSGDYELKLVLDWLCD
jgi:hypothetical protein